jgi:asparagine synthase (glutamine-hydrolysing)
LHLSGPGWTEAAPSEGIRCGLKGQVYLDGTPIGVDDLARHLSSAPSSPQSLTASLTRLNGFYAWVTQADQELRAGVDHVRSRHLFYGQAEGRFFLADDAEWVRQQVGDREMDTIAREEFQLAGCVTGADTLFPHVKQLQAGEYLVATAGEGGVIRVETQRYYRFLHTEPESYDDTALGAELDRVAVASVRPLMDYAGGRQIVVPLSGGYDSRLIVTLLKRLGYDNILAFIYGVPGNKEPAYSQRVAEALGLRWHIARPSGERHGRRPSAGRIKSGPRAGQTSPMSRTGWR